MIWRLEISRDGCKEDAGFIRHEAEHVRSVGRSILCDPGRNCVGFHCHVLLGGILDRNLISSCCLIPHRSQ